MELRDPWRLPSAASFVDEIEGVVSNGLVIVAKDAAMPSELSQALRVRFERQSYSCRILAARADAPLAQIAGVLNCLQDFSLLSSVRFATTLLLADFSELKPTASAQWCTFLERFHASRHDGTTGLSIIVLNAHDLSVCLPILRWEGRLQRLDTAIWADLHSPSSRQGLLADLAAALAVELCAWRLDLAADLVQAHQDGILDPLAWLRGRSAAPMPGHRRFAGKETACPLAVLEANDRGALETRIWRAQLTTLFPWIEEQRQKLIAKHRHKLRIDDHLRGLGVEDIEEIELGALQHQLRVFLSGNERDQLARLARMRNALAHRRPAVAEDIRMSLAACDTPSGR